MVDNHQPARENVWGESCSHHGPEAAHHADHGHETDHHHHGPGADRTHSHAAAEHGHFHEEELDALEQQELEIDPNTTTAPNPGWLILNSVGVDIGSSTSHLTFSRLFLERRGYELSSRFVTVRRDVLFRSPILLTPYRDIETIDVEKLSAFILKSYHEANLEPSAIHTGAVICTGEAVKKKNSEAITRMLSQMGGKFVCATAGPRLEAILAAHGSGAVARSRPDRTVLNLDLGGGTTKVTFVRNGTILETGAVNVGARLVAWDGQGRLTRIEETGRKIAEGVGLALQKGMVLSEDQKRLFGRALATLLFQYLQREAPSPLLEKLLITGPLAFAEPIDEIVYSGGVGEYLYGRDRQDYGDLGPVFAEEVRQRIPVLKAVDADPGEAIRATVIGASQYTVQVSSSTIFISDPSIVPLRDYQVVVPRFDGNGLTADSVAQAIRESMERFDLLKENHKHPVAFYIRWPYEISYSSIHTLASGIAHARALSGVDYPLVLIFDADIGRLVGAVLKEDLEIPSEVVAIDEIDVSDLDFVDIGQELGNKHAVPVVVKSLIFE